IHLRRMIFSNDTGHAASPSQIAAPPFNDPDADIVLHTSDNMDFRVHSAILSIVSPFFKQMFTLPQPPPPYDGSTEPIQVSEDSLTLDYLLRFIYPGMTAPKTSSWGALRSLFEAFLKYQMEGTGAFEEVLSSLLVTSRQPDLGMPNNSGRANDAGRAKSVLRVYATIWKHRIVLQEHFNVLNILRSLAKGALTIPYHELTAAYLPELDELPASELLRLQRWVQLVKMTLHTPTFKSWERSDSRFKAPCLNSSTRSKAQNGYHRTQLVPEPTGSLLPKDDLLKWYKSVFVSSFCDRRRSIPLAPSWTCAVCEGKERDRCSKNMEHKIRAMCEREMGLALASTTVRLSGELGEEMMEAFKPLGDPSGH
ncbi:hypothetical protein V5O48_017826, partial [Marasmius crinis-equi]